MADGSEGHERHAADEARRRRRSDWFGRTLGAEWVEVEPGIFEHRSVAEPAESKAAESLDEELLGALPTPERDAESEPEEAPTEASPSRRWFRH